MRFAPFALACLALGCSDPAESPAIDAAIDAATDAGSADGSVADERLTVVPTGATATSAIVADAGGTITLTGASHTYTLEITPGALASDVEITLDEVTIPELPGALAVRFSPDGLVFDVPALLRVDAPYDDVMLAIAFRAGEPGLEVAHAAPVEDGLAMQIAHFSDAALVPAADADAALDDEDVASAAMVTSIERSEALGLGTILNGRVTLLVENAGVRVVELEAASRELQRARASVMADGLEDLDASRFGPPTVGELLASLLATFEANAIGLYEDLTQPTCGAGLDVVALDDWARAVHRLLAALEVLAITPPARGLCVSTRLRADSTPDTLTPATDEVVLSTVTLELVGPSTDPRVQPIGDAVFTFVPVGADGPLELESATGELTDVHFVRPPAASGRPPEVTITIDAGSSDIQLGALPAPMPVTVTVREAAIYAGTISVSSSCMTVTNAMVSCEGGPVTTVEVLDDMRYAIDATLRVTVAGDAINVEASAVTATRFTNHEVDEHHQPLVTEDLDSVADATATREADGRIRARICGPTTESTRDEPCSGAVTITPRTTTACWELFLSESPTAAPIELAPAPIVLGCGSESPSSTGTLSRE